MGYEIVEAGLLDVIRKATGFDGETTSAGDYRILAQSREFYAILTPGPIRDRSLIAVPRYIQTQWIIHIELFVPFVSQVSEVAETLRVSRQSLMDIVDAYPNLNSTTGVSNAFLEGATAPETRRGDGRRWWVQTLQVMVQENTSVTILE